MNYLLIYLLFPLSLWGVIVLGYTAAYGTVLTSVSMPSIWTAFYSEYLGGIVPSIGFLATTWPTVRGRGSLSSLSVSAYLVAILLVIVWFVGGWGYGVKYQGQGYVLLFSTLNILATACMLRLIWLLKRNPQVGKKMLLMCFTWFWVAWIAFPWLGEVP